MLTQQIVFQVKSFSFKFNLRAKIKFEIKTRNSTSN